MLVTSDGIVRDASELQLLNVLPLMLVTPLGMETDASE